MADLNRPQPALRADSSTQRIHKSLHHSPRAPSTRLDTDVIRVEFNFCYSQSGSAVRPHDAGPVTADLIGFSKHS